jgi:hypothetical protein
VDNYYRVICIDADGNCIERFALGLDKARRLGDEAYSARIEPARWAAAWRVDVSACAWTGDALDVATAMGNA